MENSYAIRALGPCVIDSPVESTGFVAEDDRVLVDVSTRNFKEGGCADQPSLERAGPRRNIFFQPSTLKAGIVTCGGLCPGLNDVVRALVMVAWYRYGVRNIVGLRYGYEGLAPEFGHLPVELTPDKVADIHQHGGTVLGTSRGNQDEKRMVDFLVDQSINVLFAVGGDGTQRGALAIADEAARRGVAIGVVGIPKTIDNDLAYTDRTFGFETAVAESHHVIDCAHMEAKAVRNGVGLVRLMGRDSGFVAAYAALASSDVNLVLIPEAPFAMPRLMEFLEQRLRHKAHAVVVVAEGAGLELVGASETDASGNRKFGDIGVFLRDRITEHCRRVGLPVQVKYMDPSYTIRSVAANANDSVFCFRLAENAVHAALAGRTAMVVGYWNGQFVHIPTALAISARKRIDVNGLLWQSVLDNTGQPKSLA